MRLSLPRNIRWPGGLSSRLQLLTAAFVLIAEIMILVPSLAAFQERWLLDRVRQAEIASGVVEAAPDQLVPDRLARRGSMGGRPRCTSRFPICCRSSARQ